MAVGGYHALGGSKVPMLRYGRLLRGHVSPSSTLDRTLPMIPHEVVTQWLEEEGVEAVDAEIPEEDVLWAITFRVSGRFQTLVAHRNVEPTDISMQTSLDVAPNHQEALKAASADDRDSFMYDLRVALLQSPVGYTLEFSDDEPEIWTKVWFGLRLFEENVTKAGFFRRHHQLQSAAALAAVMIQKFERFGTW